jgi:hypothetical protein
MTRYPIWLAGAAVLSLLLSMALLAGEAPATPKPLIVTAPDLAFRVDAIVEGTVQGRILVRLGGEWMEVTAPVPPPVLPAQP